MTDAPEILFDWDGEAMCPVGQHARLADQTFVVGYRYVLEARIPADQRSRKQHERFFATTADTYWQNLPERYQYEPWAAPPDFLRQRALIETGWFNVREYICATNAEALRWMSNLPDPRNERGDRVYVQRSVAGSVLVERTAKSQSYRSMKKADFQKSCEDVESFLADLVGIDRGAVQ